MTFAGVLFVALAANSLGAGTSLNVPYEKYVLPENGLEVILAEDHDLPIAAVNIWYHAGPINESPKRTGFAHLFEHLMFQGSKHVGDDLHFKILEASGASLINGTTDYDRTNYFETVPSNNLELVLWLESDRMGFLLDSLTQAKLDNQREVVMNERRQSVENVPYGPSGEKLIQTVFAPEHPYYGYVIGSMADLTSASLQDVKDFYTQYYAPANATLVVAGDFDPATVKPLINRYFGTLPRRPAPSKQPVATAPITSERRVTVKEHVTLPRIAMTWLSPSAYTPGDADADVLASVLGAGKSSRLYRRLVRDLELAQNVSATQDSMTLVSTFNITVTAKPGADLKKLEAELQKVIDGVNKEPPTAREVERARNILMTHMVTGLQSIGGFGGKADMLNRYNQYVGDPGFLPKDLARYDSVTPDSIQKLALPLLDSNKRAVVITVPQS